MTLQINYKNISLKKNSSNLVLFIDDTFSPGSIKKYISGKEYLYISDLLAVKNRKKKIVSYDITSKKKIILVSVKKDLTSSEAESLGAKFYDNFKDSELNSFIINCDTIKHSLKNFTGYFLHGLVLKSYTFEKYKSKKNKKKIVITIIGKNKPTLDDQIKFKAIENGTFFARDLVSEPGNILHPDEYAKR